MRPSDLTRLVLLAAIWGGSFLFVRMAVGAIGPMWLTELRVGLAAIAMMIYARATGFELKLAQNWRAYLVLGILNTALPWGCMPGRESISTPPTWPYSTPPRPGSRPSAARSGWASA